MDLNNRIIKNCRPPSPDDLTEVDDLVILGVTIGAKMTFEKHLRSVTRAAAQMLGIMRKS